jgi:hypothetical protein
MEQGPRRVCRGDVGCVGYAVESLCVVTVPCLNWIKKKKKKKKKKNFRGGQSFVHDRVMMPRAG